MLDIHPPETPIAQRKPAPHAEDPVPLVHASIVGAFVDYLDRIGADVVGGMQRARLPLAAVDADVSDPAYVPCLSLCAWVADAARRSNIDNIGLRVADRAGVAGLPAGLVAAMARSATLRDALKVLCREADSAGSGLQIRLIDGPAGVRLCHRGSFGRQVEGQVELEWWTLGVLIHLVRLFLGPDWQPALMAVPSRGSGRRYAAELLPRTRFIGDPEQAWIAIPRRELGANLHVASDFADGEEQTRPPRGLKASLLHVLSGQMSHGHPTIGATAKLANMSVRTLQRRLHSEGCTYSEIVEEAKYRRAKELLSDPTARVIDVAYDTGYTDPSHFSRAFRRMSGLSPREFCRGRRSPTGLRRPPK
jgi:AraC-like DNA-binding protein